MSAVNGVNAGTKPGLGTLIAAVLLPPLGVFLIDGLRLRFWIAVLLTLFGWIPGLIFALVVVLRPGLIARH